MSHARHGKKADELQVLTGHSRVESRDSRSQVTDELRARVKRVRTALIAVALIGRTITYKQLAVATNGAFHYWNPQRVLDVLSEDCIYRGEPSLAALVVSASDGEVGHGYLHAEDAGDEREALYDYWRETHRTWR